MKRRFIFILMFIWSPLVFGDLDQSIYQIVAGIQVWGHNGGHGFSSHNYGDELMTEEKKETLLDLRSELFNYGSCISPKVMMGSSQNLYVKMKHHLLTNLRDIYSTNDIPERDWQHLSDSLEQLLFAEENILVLYSAFTWESSWDSIRSTGCLMYKFRIFRKDGNVIHLNFDITD